MSTIMAVGAHPDDIEIGIGATLRKALREGHRVICVDLTDGEETPYGNRELRRRETARANAILGITERVCLELPNRVLQDSEEARRRLATVMRRYRPDIIFGHLEQDAHPDHVAAFTITRGAILLSRVVKIDLPHAPHRPGRLFHFICSHLRAAYQPSFVLAVAPEDLEAKIAAVLAYESQFVANPANRFVEGMLRQRLAYYGSLARLDCGEPVISQEPIGLESIFAVR